MQKNSAGGKRGRSRPVKQSTGLKGSHRGSDLNLREKALDLRISVPRDTARGSRRSYGIACTVVLNRNYPQFGRDTVFVRGQANSPDISLPFDDTEHSTPMP